MAKKKNKNVPPMTQAIEEPVQSPQQTPNTGYPNSAYPNSGYPNSGYPNSAYPGSGYFVQEKKKSLAVPIAIAAGVVVIVAVMAVLFLMRNNNQMGMMPPPPPPMNATPGSVLLNGQTVTFDVIQEDGKTFLPVDDFAKAVNYDCVIDGDTIKIIAPTEISTLEIGSTKVNLEDQTVGTETSVSITTEPFRNGDKVYIYSRDVALFLKNAYVTYNPQMQIVEINVGMGGPGGPPPPPPQGGGYGGPPPQGGGYGAPPQQGGAAGQPPQDGGAGQPPQQ